MKSDGCQSAIAYSRSTLQDSNPITTKRDNNFKENLTPINNDNNDRHILKPYCTESDLPPQCTTICSDSFMSRRAAGGWKRRKTVKERKEYCGPNTSVSRGFSYSFSDTENTDRDIRDICAEYSDLTFRDQPSPNQTMEMNEDLHGSQPQYRRREWSPPRSNHGRSCKRTASYMYPSERPSPRHLSRRTYSRDEFIRYPTQREDRCDSPTRLSMVENNYRSIFTPTNTNRSRHAWKSNGTYGNAPLWNSSSFYSQSWEDQVAYQNHSFSFSSSTSDESMHSGHHRNFSNHEELHSGPTTNDDHRFLPPRGDNYSTKPRTWACDYCSVAVFKTFEEATAHEEVCKPHAKRSIDRGDKRDDGCRKRGPSDEQVFRESSYAGTDSDSKDREKTCKARLCSQVSKTSSVNSKNPPLSITKEKVREKELLTPSQCSIQPPVLRKLTVLARPQDKYSLSDRQCFVRSNFVEVFAATEADVRARHSKGAQKLFLGQVGLRCIFCTHLNPKDRIERAVCYPSSISRIYQTVADMQRFHFESCPEIPKSVRSTYKSLKTTRPRGVGSPQDYWIESAHDLNLIDANKQIRFGAENKPEDTLVNKGVYSSQNSAKSNTLQHSEPSYQGEMDQINVCLNSDFPAENSRITQLSPPVQQKTSDACTVQNDTSFPEGSHSPAIELLSNKTTLSATYSDCTSDKAGHNLSKPLVPNAMSSKKKGRQQASEPCQANYNDISCHNTDEATILLQLKRDNVFS